MLTGYGCRAFAGKRCRNSTNQQENLNASSVKFSLWLKLKGRCLISGLPIRSTNSFFAELELEKQNP